MDDKQSTLPLAGPETQTLNRAHAGGTGGQTDFSRSSQRSRLRTGFRYRRPPFDDPSPFDQEVGAG